MELYADLSCHDSAWYQCLTQRYLYRTHGILARQPIPRQPFPDDLTDGHIEPICVLQRVAVVILAVIVAR